MALAQNAGESSQASATPSEVKPTDPAYQQLWDLNQRYACFTQAFFQPPGDRPHLTRQEFALGIDFCLDQINNLIAANSNRVQPEDLQTLAQLQQEFAPELAQTHQRVDSLEATAEELDGAQFSTTTKLEGEVAFELEDSSPITITAPALTLSDTLARPRAGAPGDVGNLILGVPPAGGIRQAAPAPHQTFSGRSRLESNTNFTGLPANAPLVPNAPLATGQASFDPDNFTDFNREEYNPIFENEFLRVQDSPLSTFSIDVDAASYSNVRRFLTNSQLPPVDAVRIEELINYFTYDYPDPDDDEPFSITTEMARAPWNPRHQLIHIGLQGERIDTDDLPDSNLVFLLDVSGSMMSPDKLPLLKSAFRLLVNELDEDDQVSIVVYAGAAGLVLPPTPGDEKETILAAIESLEAGGSTAGGAGVQLAYDTALEHFIRRGNNRVILATDGDFNVGTSSEAELIRLIEERREDDVFLTVLGFGTGNLQDAKMEQLANHGNGNYAYIDNIREAKKVLVSELGATLLTIAKDVKIQVEFNPAQVQAYRLIGYENRLLADEDFNDDTKDAGELGAGHSVTALYEIIPASIEPDVDLPEVDDLRYQQVTIDPDAYDSDELLQVKLRYKEPTADTSQLITQSLRNRSRDINDSSDDFKFSAAVAAFGMMLRNSQYQGDVTADRILDLAREGRGDDEGGYRAEFIRLVENYELLVLAQGDR
jgi:Ca-activated chloride channel family protein